jgi:hypothetical protein
VIQPISRETAPSEKGGAVSRYPGDGSGDEPDGRDSERTNAGLWLGAVGCAAFVFAALAAEVVAAEYADSTVPSWTIGVFPLTWSQPARVVWWLAVAAAALGYRLLLGRLGVRPRRWVTVMTVTPFVIFAGGVVWGASWATWH